MRSDAAKPQFQNFRFQIVGTHRVRPKRFNSSTIQQITRNIETKIAVAILRNN